MVARGSLLGPAHRTHGRAQYRWDHFPSVEEVREALIEDPDVYVRDLDGCRVVERPGGVEAFVHPVNGAVVRFRRGRFGFVEGPEGAREGHYAADILGVKQDESLRAFDPLVAAYEKQWAGSADDGSQPLTTVQRMFLAIELADTSLLKEAQDAFVDMITDPMFVVVGIGGILAYVGLWLAPELLVTKSVATALTVGLMATFTAADIGTFIGATLGFSNAVARAKDPDQLAKMGNWYLETLGPVGANLFMLVAGAAAGLIGEAGVRGAGAVVRGARAAREVDPAAIRAVEEAMAAVVAETGAAGAVTRLTARELAQRLVDQLPKLSRSAGTLDSLAEIFSRSSSAVGAGKTEFLPHHTIGHSQELRSIIQACMDPEVALVELIPAGSIADPVTGRLLRTPDMEVRLLDGTRYRVEIRSVTGSDIGYQPKWSSKPRRVKVQDIIRAVQDKARNTARRASQLATDLGPGGPPPVGRIDVHLPFGGTAADVDTAMQSMQNYLGARGHVQSVQFFLGNKGIVIYVRDAANVFVAQAVRQPFKLPPRPR